MLFVRSIALILLFVCFGVTEANEGQYRITLDRFGGMAAHRFDATRYPRLAGEFEPARCCY